MEDKYSDQEAEGLISKDKLRKKLIAISDEQAGLERRLAELADGEKRLRELDALPNLIEEYLRELPRLLNLKPLLREYKTSAPEPTQDDPLGALYTITPERVRFLTRGGASGEAPRGGGEAGSAFQGTLRNAEP